MAGLFSRFSGNLLTGLSKHGALGTVRPDQMTSNPTRVWISEIVFDKKELPEELRSNLIVKRQLYRLNKISKFIRKATRDQNGDLTKGIPKEYHNELRDTITKFIIELDANGDPMKLKNILTQDDHKTLTAVLDRIKNGQDFQRTDLSELRRGLRDLHTDIVEKHEEKVTEENTDKAQAAAECLPLLAGFITAATLPILDSITQSIPQVAPFFAPLTALFATISGNNGMDAGIMPNMYGGGGIPYNAYNPMMENIMQNPHIIAAMQQNPQIMQTFMQQMMQTPQIMQTFMQQMMQNPQIMQAWQQMAASRVAPAA